MPNPSSSIANDPDFIRLQNLQLSQTAKVTELRTQMNQNFMEISRQLSLLTRGGKKAIEDTTIKDPPANQQPYYVSEVDLDNPHYANCMVNSEESIPAQNIKVQMPRFDGTDTEGWLYQVRRYFIFNKTPENKKLLLVSFHLDGLARKWFTWMEASNLLSDWKSFVKSILRKFSNAQYVLPGGKLSKLIQKSTVTEYTNEFEDLCTKVLGLPEYFILEMFISSLKEEIQKRSY